MANPQKENGYTAIANEIMDNIIKLQLAGSEWKLLLFVFRKTYGFNKKQDLISLSQFQKACSLNRTQVCKGLKSLVSRLILLKDNNGLSFNKNFNQWIVSKLIPSIKIDNLDSVKIDNGGVSKMTHTKVDI